MIVLTQKGNNRGKVTDFFLFTYVFFWKNEAKR